MNSTQKRDALAKGDALIKINSDGLEPELEAFMWKIIDRVQVRDASFDNVRTIPQHRELLASARMIDDDTRTVELAFSSETPYERYWGIEILGHAADEIRLDRLRNAGPVCIDHNTSVRDQVAVIDSVTIGADKVGRATVRFSKRADAEEVFQDVKDGIISKVSVGYMVHALVLESETEDIPTYRVTDWEPYEISLVAVPADDSVGVGRSATANPQPEATMPNEDTATASAVENTDAISDTDHIDKTREREVDQMRATGRHFEQERLAEDYIHLGKGIADLRSAIWDAKRDAIQPVPVTHLDMEKKQVQRYSLMNAIRAAVARDWSKASFEHECSNEIADKLGRDARGFFVPFDIQQRAPDLNVTDAAGLVGTDHLAGSFIDLLRARAVVAAAGATMLPGLVGNIDIPKQTGGATFYWLADDADVTDSDSAYGSVALSPKTVAGSTPMSRRLLKQSAPSVEQLVLNDLVRGAALAIDLAAMEGTGADSQPLGIVGQTGVNTQVVTAAGAPTWAEIVGFETAVDADDALIGSLRYVTTPAVVGHAKTTAKDAGSGLFLMAGTQINGYEVSRSTQLTAARIIFGNFTDVLIGLWGVLDVNPDMAAKAAAGGLVLRVFQDIDIAVRHAESFCINA